MVSILFEVFLAIFYSGVFAEKSTQSSATQGKALAEIAGHFASFALNVPIADVLEGVWATEMLQCYTILLATVEIIAENFGPQTSAKRKRTDGIAFNPDAMGTLQLFFAQHFFGFWGPKQSDYVAVFNQSSAILNTIPDHRKSRVSKMLQGIELNIADSHEMFKDKKTYQIHQLIQGTPRPIEMRKYIINEKPVLRLFVKTLLTPPPPPQGPFQPTPEGRHPAFPGFELDTQPMEGNMPVPGPPPPGFEYFGSDDE